jgi:hypothetical protein
MISVRAEDAPLEISVVRGRHPFRQNLYDEARSGRAGDQRMYESAGMYLVRPPPAAVNPRSEHHAR